MSHPLPAGEGGPKGRVRERGGSVPRRFPYPLATLAALSRRERDFIYAISNRSAFMTLVQAATKSRTKPACASAEP